MMLSFLSHPLPTVDPEHIKALWPLTSLEAGVAIERRVLAERCSPNADVIAVWARAILIKAMLEQGLLNRWLDGDTPQDKVFAVAAATPLRLQEWTDGAAFLARLESQNEEDQTNHDDD
jgi:hypothetical protein